MKFFTQHMKGIGRLKGVQWKTTGMIRVWDKPREGNTDLIQPGETKAKWGHNFSLPQCKVGL